jgi:hypothetical protein
MHGLVSRRGALRGVIGLGAGLVGASLLGGGGVLAAPDATEDGFGFVTRCRLV